MHFNAYRMITYMCMSMVMPMSAMTYSHLLPAQLYTGFDVHSLT